MKPSVGRIVHYKSRGSADGVFPPACRAAIITAVRENDGTSSQILNRLEYVALAVLNPTGLFFDDYIEHDEERGPGSWHWPERVPSDPVANEWPPCMEAAPNLAGAVPPPSACVLPVNHGGAHQNRDGMEWWELTSGDDAGPAGPE